MKIAALEIMRQTSFDARSCNGCSKGAWRRGGQVSVGVGARGFKISPSNCDTIQGSVSAVTTAPTTVQYKGLLLLFFYNH